MLYIQERKTSKYQRSLQPEPAKNDVYAKNTDSWSHLRNKKSLVLFRPRAGMLKLTEFSLDHCLVTCRLLQCKQKRRTRRMHSTKNISLQGLKSSIIENSETFDNRNTNGCEERVNETELIVCKLHSRTIETTPRS